MNSALSSHRRVDSNLSLVMTVLNEETGMASFLESLADQTLLPGEIVVVDGGSTDGTVRAIQGWSPPEGVKLVLDESAGAGISEGRNRAIAISRADRIIATDAGTQLDPNWVSELSKNLDDVDVASGFFEPMRGSFVSSVIGAIITPHVSEIDPLRFLPSSRSIGFKKAAWEDVEGYPEWLDYCEDLLFDLALQNSGATFRFVPTAIVRWDARPSLSAFAKQYYRYARGDGKAGLWPRRHAVRYAAYAAGLALAGGAIALSPVFWAVLLIAAGCYMSKYLHRVYKFRHLFDRRFAAASAMVPLVVIIGDVAKMMGYPAGISWRRKNRNTNARSHIGRLAAERQSSEQRS